MSGNIVYDGTGTSNTGGSTGTGIGGIGAGGSVAGGVIDRGDGYLVKNSGHTYTLVTKDGYAIGGTVGDQSSLTYTGGIKDLLQVYDSLFDLNNPFTEQVVTGFEYTGKVEFGGDYDKKTKNIYKVKYGYTDAYYKFNDALFQAQAEFTKNESLSKIPSSEKDDNWDIDFTFLTGDWNDDYDKPKRTLQKLFVELNTTGELNRWMAGGDMYDAPRAGGSHFNVTGNMNTTKFLGLDYNNLDVSFRAREGLDGEPYQILPITAGKNMQDGGANIFAIIHNAKIMNSKDSIILNVNGTIDTGSITTSDSVEDKGVNSLEDFWQDVKDWFGSW